ncbi:hypothetical protein GKZ89_18430 [Bacillus mangrovi]|uniref:Phosphoglycerate mutase n=1 Tax=Metabacillus mangrovi TaxID=1491830 RepID=A0A7X2S8K7_9BACI|nr:histidine phosphatase family protein [Metabacillus mangrovi]MTH55372.1 hypothetical protein [Metabacillus mangrovi]
MEKKIYVIRHCESGGQDADAALTEEGKNQALMLTFRKTDTEKGRLNRPSNL